MSNLKYLHETTNTWTTSYKQPNHIYILDGTTCVGYIQEGKEIEKMFRHVLRNFSKKGRTFKHLKTRKDVNAVIDGWLQKVK